MSYPVYRRKPIVATGAQNVRVVFDSAEIQDIKTRVPVYPHGTSDASYYIPDYQPLVASKNPVSDRAETTAVIGTANSLGTHVVSQIPDYNTLPKPLLHRMIMDRYMSAGVSLSSFSPGMNNTDGFVSQYAGTSTIKTYTHISAGQTLYVDVPYEEEVDALKFAPTAGAPDNIKLVARPAHPDNPAQLAKQAVMMSVLHQEDWNNLVRDLPCASLGNAAATIVDSSILKGIQFLRLMIQIGLVGIPAGPVPTESEWRGTQKLRDDIHDLAGRTPLRGDAHQGQVPSAQRRALTADCAAIALYSALMGIHVGTDPDEARFYDQHTNEYKNDMEMLRKSVAIACAQDGESNSVMLKVATFGSDGNYLDLSVNPGFVPKDRTTGDPEYDILSQSQKTGSNFNLTKVDRKRLTGLKSLTINHMTKEFSARRAVEENPNTFAVAINSAGPGETVDIKIISGTRGGY